MKRGKGRVETSLWGQDPQKRREKQREGRGQTDRDRKREICMVVRVLLKGTIVNVHRR